jgi:DNA polymerase-4
LSQDVTRSLRRRRLLTRTVRLKIRFSGFETHTAQATLPSPTDVDAEFLPTAERLLAEALRRGRPVRLIGIGAAGLGEAGQESLFDGGRGRQRRLDESLDELNRRFGPGAVVRGQVAAQKQLDFRRDDLDRLLD